jgi:hypothetical protein
MFSWFFILWKNEFKFQILVITKWAVKFMFKIWRLQKWVLPFNLPLYYRYKVQPNKSNNGEESHYNCNEEESHYKVQPNKSNNGLLHMPLHCILITIILPVPVLNQTLPMCLLRWLVCLELSWTNSCWLPKSWNITCHKDWPNKWSCKSTVVWNKS